MESSGSGFLGLAYFTQHTVLRDHPRRSPYRQSLLKLSTIPSQYLSLSSRLSISIWAASALGAVNKATESHLFFHPLKFFFLMFYIFLSFPLDHSSHLFVLGFYLKRIRFFFFTKSTFSFLFIRLALHNCIYYITSFSSHIFLV